MCIMLYILSGFFNPEKWCFSPCYIHLKMGSVIIFFNVFFRYMVKKITFFCQGGWLPCTGVKKHGKSLFLQNVFCNLQNKNCGPRKDCNLMSRKMKNLASSTKSLCAFWKKVQGNPMPRSMCFVFCGKRTLRVEIWYRKNPLRCASGSSTIFPSKSYGFRVNFVYKKWPCVFLQHTTMCTLRTM